MFSSSYTDIILEETRVKLKIQSAKVAHNKSIYTERAAALKHTTGEKMHR
jgi:hypothetical protein